MVLRRITSGSNCLRAAGTTLAYASLAQVTLRARTFWSGRSGRARSSSACYTDEVFKKMAESFLGIHLLGKGKGTQFFVLDSIDQPKIEFGGKEFRQKLSGKKACYYDWLRDSNEQIFGLKFIPYWNFLIDWKIRSSLSSVEDDLYAIYFGEQREYIPGISADQTDFGSKLFGDGRTYILTFGLANSTLEAKEVEQINRLVLSQK